MIVVLLSVLLLAVGCSSSDPLTEPVYSEAEGSYIRLDSSGNGGYIHEYSLDAINLSPGSSGATLIAPNASSLGGYQLNGIGEYIFFGSHIDDDWDGVGDGEIEIYFEVNDDNSGGLATDTVKFQLEVWHKMIGEQTCIVYSLDGTTIVGAAVQHDLFIQEIAIDNLREEEVLSFRLNLNTITGDVTDVIVNYIEFKYPTYYPAMEVN
jgi:hypothetical protein